MTRTEKAPISNHEALPSQRGYARRILGAMGAREACRYYLLFQRVHEKRGTVLHDLNKAHGISTLRSMEGYIDTEQQDWLVAFVRNAPAIKTIAQTGFNGGHSAAVLLGAREDTTLSSFDLGEHKYVANADKFIKETFPERHSLILGDSKTTLSEHKPKTPFDMIFIDGGHDYETALADVKNFSLLASKGATVIMDDYLPGQHYGIGPYTAWNDAIEQGIITHGGVSTSGRRAWAYGTYTT